MEGYELDLLDFLPAYEEIDTLYNYYDEKSDANGFLNKSIFLKKEFNELQTDNTQKERAPGKFTPLNHQSFAARFLSQYTPYNKLLAIHEVGTGKTCLSSLTVEIAKQENPFLKEALFIVKNDTLKRNVVREISEVCTSGKYMPSREIKDPRQYSMLLNRLIGTNYITYTYYEVKKEIENMTDNEIDEYFSNRIIIIDEAHNLCIKSEDSVVYSHIHRMLHNIHNYKILLLTATPMRDNPKDIALILNLLLPIEQNFNDKTFMSDYFDKDKKFLESKKNEFQNKVRGIISYLRASSSSVTRMYEGKNLKDVSSKLSVVEMLPDSIQTETYEKAYKLDVQCKKSDNMVEQDEDAPDDEDVSCFYSNSRQASVFVAPDGTYGSGIVESGWYNQSAAESNQQRGKIDSTIKKLYDLIDTQRKNLTETVSEETKKEIQQLIDDIQEEIEKLTKQKNEKASFKTSKRATGEVSEKLIKYLKENGNSQASMLKSLKNLSIKYASILEVLLSDKSKNDKAFIYSNMVSFTGANLLAALFKVFGFEHVKMPSDNDKINKDEKLLMNNFRSKTGKPQFLLITGSSIDSRASDFLINKIYNNPLNKNGDYIKVVIASRIIGEGSSFKHTRQLHIVNPGWNETELEQAQGRAIRAFSHDIFPLNERYVKIYRWCAIADRDSDSIDYILYKICSDKDRPIQQVERLLKMSAVDCAINYKRNMNINSENKLSFDSNFSRECDYDECVYQCAGVPSKWYIDGNSPELIYDSYNLYYANEKLLQIQHRIEELFKNKFMYDFFEIMKGLRDLANDVIIVRSIKRIIDESIPIKNKYNIISYLREENNFYFLTDTLQYSFQHKFLQAYYNARPIIREVDTYNELLTIFETRYFDTKLSLLKQSHTSPDEFERLVYSIGDDITSIMIERFIMAKYTDKTQNKDFRDKFLQLYENIKTIVTDKDKVYFKLKGRNVRIFTMKDKIWENASTEESAEYTDILKSREQTLKTDNPFGFYGIYKTKEKKKTFGFITFFKPSSKAVSTGDVNKAQQETGKSCENPGNQFPAFYNKILLISMVIIAKITERQISLNIIKPKSETKELKKLMSQIEDTQNENIKYVVKNIFKYLSKGIGRKIDSVDNIIPVIKKHYPQLLEILEGIADTTRKDLCPVMEKWCSELGIITEIRN